jgi:hypothetical protein
VQRVYEPKRQRTVLLVRQSVHALLKAKRKVSLMAIVMTSKELDRKHLGISASAILGNDEARELYEAHRTWRAPRGKRRFSVECLEEMPQPRVKAGRDLRLVYERYLQMPKRDLALRLLKMEESYVALEETWLQANDTLYNAMLGHHDKSVPTTG